MCWPRMLAAAVSMVAWLAVPGVVHAAAPPDRQDPCAHDGRDTCGTTGVGFYRAGNYGVRWFGDFRGAIPGQPHAFCLDLRYWYASPAYRYAPRNGPLRNRDGELVRDERQQQIAYAIWRYGRSSSPVQQAAVMLYVHAMMGDERPGEGDPAAVGADVVPLYRRIVRDTARFHGPYRVAVQLPARLRVEQPATAAIRVLSARGTPLPNVRLSLSANGASLASGEVRTNAAGVASLRVTPTTLGNLRVSVQTERLAAARVHVFAPTTAKARANGQRLAVPAADAVTGSASRPVAAAPTLSTRASAQQTAPGATIHDTVTVGGIGTSTVTIRAALWGPFPSRAAITCAGTPYWAGTVVAHGDGSFPTPPVRLDRAGFYAFQETITALPGLAGVVTPCGETAETTVVRARATLETVASPQLVRPGARIRDRIRTSGLGRTPAAIEVELFGPFASRSAIRCTYRRLLWHGRISVQGDGETASPPVAVARAGFYSFRERLIGTPLAPGTTTPCGVAAETMLAAPAIVTGRGDTAAFTSAGGAGGRTPVRITIPSLGIDAPIAPAAIDLAHGVLGVPADIHRVGWWRDGAAPGAAHGAVLLGGHRDSATGGDGAFFGLATARPGAAIELVDAAGRRFAYTIASIRSYPKARLPLAAFDTTGRPRLVLVTCGGTFDAATGHYPDNVVVTAVPRP